MGEKNDTFSYYVGKEEVLADLYNAVVYGGRQAICPENLADVQRTYHEPLTSRYGKKRRVQRERDAAKLLCREGCPVLLAVENQDEMNHGMPLRCAEYDVEEFQKQMRRIRKRHMQARDLKPGAEYRSGFRAEDRLIPVITLVVYHGDGKWRAAESMREMFSLDGMDGELRAYLENYRIHVVNLAEQEEERFQTGLRELVGMLKRKDDPEAMRAYLRDNEARFREMDEDTYDMLCVMLDLKGLEVPDSPGGGGRSEKRKEKEEKRDMCRAFEILIQRSREEGKAEGRAEGKAEGRKEGELDGRERGEERLGRLITRLLSDGRIDEAAFAARDAGERSRLYREYSL